MYLVVELERKWKGSDGFGYGYDKLGNIYLAHLKCKTTMVFKGLNPKKGRLFKEFICPLCGTKKTI